MLFDAVVKKQEWHPVLRSALLVIITFGGMGAAYLLHTDYDAKGSARNSGVLYDETDAGITDRGRLPGVLLGTSGDRGVYPDCVL